MDAPELGEKIQQKREYITDKQQTIMKRIKITAIAKNGKCLNMGFTNKQMAEEYADAMTSRGFIVVKQYK